MLMCERVDIKHDELCECAEKKAIEHAELDPIRLYRKVCSRVSLQNLVVVVVVVVVV